MWHRLVVVVPQMLRNQSEVLLGGVHVRMSEEALDVTNVQTTSQEVNRNAVSEQVWMHSAFISQHLFPKFSHPLLDTDPKHLLSTATQEKCSTIRTADQFTTHRKVVP